MSTIFLSYRRDDSAAACGRLYDRLAGHFGKNLVFKDVDDIPYGVNFPEYLAEKLHECRVQLVIIGKYWLTLTAPDGIRRLDAPNDFVRIEVEAGLRNSLLVVPVLVDNARMPEADDLPGSIRLLIERNAAQVRPDPDFHTDMERLIRRLEDLLGMPHTSYTGGPGGASAQVPDPVTVQLVQEIEAAFGAQSWRLVIDKARYLLAKAGTNAPAIAILRYGQALLAQGEVAEASGTLGTLHQQKIGELRILREAADALAQAKDYTGAAALLEDGLALAENDADQLAVLTAYCPVLVQLEQWDLVLARATDGGKLAPGDPMWMRWACDAAGRLGLFTEALALARALTSRDDATVYDWLARAQLAYAAANNVASEEARSALDSAARLSADDHPAVMRARDQILPLPTKLASLGFALRSREGVEFIVPPLCAVPAGAFEMGTQLRLRLPDKESPGAWLPHKVKVDAFQIGRFPVTVAEYACFVRAGYRQPRDSVWVGTPQDGSSWRHQLRRPDHPVVNVSWEEARDYVAWLARLTGQPWRLPTEAEWEKAARWDPQHRHSRHFPWGDALDLTRCNVGESRINDTTPVYAYPSGVSPCGAWDMSGNVKEWTSSLYMPYPYNPKDGREGVQPQSYKNGLVVRGGDYMIDGWYAHTACRDKLFAGSVSEGVGFRLALGPR